MHSGNIENYSFIHGYHRNNLTGKWFPLHPHTLGRALTHDEMDYNLLYSQQTVAGWRIFGHNVDLTLSDDEIGNSLIFHKVKITDTDYVRYVAAGYTENMYIWITPIYDCTEFYVNGEAFTTSTQRDCSGFVITLSETSPSIDSCDIFGINSTNTSASKPEGWIYVPKSIGSGSGSGSGGGSGIVPTATPNIDSGSGSGGGSGISPTATPNIDSGSGGGSGIPTPTPNIDSSSGSGSGGGSGMAPTPLPDPTATSAPIEVSYNSLKDDTGGEAEVGEIFKFIVETTGIEGSASLGYKLGGTAIQDVDYRREGDKNLQIIYQNRAIIRIEVFKAGGSIELTLDEADSQGNATKNLTHTVKLVLEGAPVDETPIEPTPIPTFEVPDPTATAIPEPTPTPTASGFSINGPNSIDEGDTQSYTFMADSMATGTTVYWELRNFGDTDTYVAFGSDLVTARTGNGVTTDNGSGGSQLEIVIEVATDSSDETAYGEQFKLVVWDDAANYATPITYSGAISGELAQKVIAINEIAPTPTVEPDPTPTPTVEIDPTATPVPDPTATAAPEPTATAEPAPIDETKDNFLFTNCRSEGIVGEGQTIIVSSAEWKAMVGTEPNAESTLRDEKGLCYGYTKPISDEFNVRLEDYGINGCKCEGEGEPEGEPVDS